MCYCKTQDINILSNAITDYFDNFDYIVGDYINDKVRLKGFYEDNNKMAIDHNKISNLNKYIENYCAYNCRYFCLKRIEK